MKNPEKKRPRKKSKDAIPFTILPEMVDDMSSQHQEILERFKIAAQMRKRILKGKHSAGGSDL